ncbi:zinc ribbon domain-containing protein [Adlercreutzia rubneri]
MFCPHCGKEITGNDPAFCGNCGSRLVSSSRAEQSPPRRKRILLYTVVLVCLLLGVAVFVFVSQANSFLPSIFRSSDEEPVRVLTDYESIGKPQDGSEHAVAYHFDHDSSGNVVRMMYESSEGCYSNTFEYDSGDNGVPSRCLNEKGVIVWEQRALDSNECGLPLRIERSYPNGNTLTFELKYQNNYRIQELIGSWKGSSYDCVWPDFRWVFNEKGDAVQRFTKDDRDAWGDDDNADSIYEYVYDHDGQLISGTLNRGEENAVEFTVVKNDPLSRSEEWRYPNETTIENYSYSSITDPSPMARLLGRSSTSVTLDLFG